MSNNLSFININSFSNLQIFNELTKSENDLLILKLKKVTNKNFKNHEIKIRKKYIAQLKAILGSRLSMLEKNQIINVTKLLTF